MKSKEVDVSRSLHSGVSENDVMKGIKPRRENGQGKAADTAIKRNIKKSYRPLSKQKSEDELKDKNQVLEAVNKQLHQKLTETQGKLKDLTEKVELLQKFQDNSLAILESKGLNPNSETLESQEESSPDHMDSMLLLETLQDELKLFNETAKKQMEELQNSSTEVQLPVKFWCPFCCHHHLKEGHCSDRKSPSMSILLLNFMISGLFKLLDRAPTMEAEPWR